MKHQNTPWLQQKLEAIWYKNSSGKSFGLGKVLLLPLSFLYCQISQYIKKRDISRQTPFPIPIIVVGNINIGGTGKTPLIIKLTELLKTNGYRPAIITRGYKGTSTHWPIEVDTETPVELAGDEAKLMAIRTQRPVIAGADRTASIHYVLKNTYSNIILSDDGLQHYKMKRDIEIVVIDAQRGFGNGYCLPAGPLREPKQRLDTCDFVITNGQLALARGNLMKVLGSTLIHLNGLDEKPLGSFKVAQVYTGIGNPQRFIDTLETQGLTVTHQVIFPDHHSFAIKDFATQDINTPIIMTEKDAVKCSNLGLENCWYLPVSAHLEKQFETNFLAKVSQVSCHNKRNINQECKYKSEQNNG